jgi:hypothetical protein
VKTSPERKGRGRRREEDLLSSGDILQLQSVSRLNVANQFVEGLHLQSQRRGK